MHPDEIHSDEALVRRLLANQFPHWSDLPVTQFHSSGTDNAMFRLGDDLVVRLPRRPTAAISLAKEQAWLPRFAPNLQIAVPLPLAGGLPSDDFPWAWSVCEWLSGICPIVGSIADPVSLAIDLAGFITTLRQIDPTDGPPPGAHNFWRGVPLAVRDSYTRNAIADITDEFNPRALSAIWEAALNAPTWHQPPVWVHGDLSAGNLLLNDNRLSAVIDFGGLALGDPACDLAVAWSLFDGKAREVFRVNAAIDDAAWDRGRGWALSIAAIQLPYYRPTSPQIAQIARAVIESVLADAQP